MLSDLVSIMEKQIIAHHVRNVTTTITPAEMLRSSQGKKIINFVYMEFAEQFSDDLDHDRGVIGMRDVNHIDKIHYGRMMCLSLWSMCRGIKNTPFIKPHDKGYDTWIDQSNGHILINCNSWYEKIEKMMALTSKMV